MRLAILVMCAALGTAGGASAQMNLNQMQKAAGLAEIIAKEEPCGYTIDQDKLAQYFEASDLDNPEALFYINGTAQSSGLMGSPTKSDCTMAKTTAQSIGVLTAN